MPAQVLDRYGNILFELTDEGWFGTWTGRWCFHNRWPESTQRSQIHLTNLATTWAETRGFVVGLTYDATAWVWQNEPKNIHFGTNDVDRGYIHATTGDWWFANHIWVHHHIYLGGTIIHNPYGYYGGEGSGGSLGFNPSTGELEVGGSAPSISGDATFSGQSWGFGTAPVFFDEGWKFLHIHEPTEGIGGGVNVIKFTNAITGKQATSGNPKAVGVELGMWGGGGGSKTDSWWWNYEDGDFEIGTGNALRYRITGDGGHGWGGVFDPGWTFHFHDSLHNWVMLGLTYDGVDTDTEFWDRGLHIGCNATDGWIYYNEPGNFYLGSGGVAQLVLNDTSGWQTLGSNLNNTAIVQAVNNSTGTSAGAAFQATTAAANVWASLGAYVNGTHPYFFLNVGVPLEYNYYNANAHVFQIGGVNKFGVDTSGVFPHADNTLTCGRSGLRWSAVWAGTGTIQTSDRRLKTLIRDLNDAELGVARRLAKRMQMFKFRDAVELKGDVARWHAGIIAQDVIDAFEDEGLDPFAYGCVGKDLLEKEERYTEIVEQDRVETRTKIETTVEIRDGVPVQIEKEVEFQKAIGIKVPVVDAQGNPVMTTRTRSVPKLDENGQPVLNRRGEPVTEKIEVEVPLRHFVPERETVTLHHRRTVPDLDDQGIQKFRYNVRYDEIYAFVIAAFASITTIPVTGTHRTLGELKLNAKAKVRVQAMLNQTLGSIITLEG